MTGPGLTEQGHDNGARRPPIPRVVLGPLVQPLVGLHAATPAALERIRDEVLPEAEVLHDGTLRYTRSTGIQGELALGDVLVLLPSGPWSIYADELEVLWTLRGAEAGE